MAKKNKKNLQKLLKQRQLQQLQATPTAGVPAPAVIASPVPIAVDTAVEQPHAAHFNREILRTLISLGVIVLLLVAATIVDRRATYFQTFGNWLYTALRLSH